MRSSETTTNPLHPSVERKLNPVFEEIYNTYQAPRLRADQVPYEEYNKDRAAFTFPTANVASPFTEVGSATIYKVPVSDPAGEIDVEVYVPSPEAIANGGLEKGQNGDGGRLPILVDFHGGGFVIGTLKDDESLCRQTAQNIGCVVANVAYRTSPEFPHPVPVTDSWTALKWVVSNAEMLGIDPARIAVSGLSAGGCIAAVLALMARDDASMPDLVKQILIVPLLDARYIPVEGRPDPATTPYDSYISLEFAPMLPVARLVWFYRLWLGTGPERGENAKDWRASPIVAESLANLAPASLHVAEIDPLASEAAAYHEALVAAGTPSKIKVYKGVGHPFGQWDGKLEEGRELIRDIATVLNEAFAS